jgi:hypothetical protein
MSGNQYSVDLSDAMDSSFAAAEEEEEEEEENDSWWGEIRAMLPLLVVLGLCVMCALKYGSIFIFVSTFELMDK